MASVLTMMRDSRCNQMSQTVFSSTAGSDSNHCAFPQSTKSRHGGQFDSMWEANHERLGLEFSAELSIAWISQKVLSDYTVSIN